MALIDFLRRWFRDEDPEQFAVVEAVLTEGDIEGHELAEKEGVDGMLESIEEEAKEVDGNGVTEELEAKQALRLSRTLALTLIHTPTGPQAVPA